MWRLVVSVVDVCGAFQEAFFHLALTNTKRISRLTASPEGLACWALEILKECAEATLKFVQDYDTSPLGLGQVLEGSCTTEDQVGVLYETSSNCHKIM